MGCSGCGGGLDSSGSASGCDGVGQRKIICSHRLGPPRGCESSHGTGALGAIYATFERKTRPGRVARPHPWQQSTKQRGTTARGQSDEHKTNDEMRAEKKQPTSRRRTRSQSRARRRSQTQEPTTVSSPEQSARAVKPTPAPAPNANRHSPLNKRAPRRTSHDRTGSGRPVVRQPPRPQRGVRLHARKTSPPG